MKLTLINMFLFLGLFSSLASPKSLSQQNKIEFRNVSVESNFPDGIIFRIEICGRPTISTAVFNYSVSPESSQSWEWGKEIWTLDEGQTADNCDKRKFYLETKNLDVPPFSPIRYFWSVTEGSKIIAQSSRYIYYYRDANHDWKMQEDPHLILWWHDRPDSFVQDILSIASKAYKDQADYYSVSLTSPIIIVITNSSDEFFAWQKKESYAGGIAFPELNLTIQNVEDGISYYDWTNDVIPHEISHIYFDHIVKRYSGAPDWLDEGMATYQEYNNHFKEWDAIRNASQSNQLLPLEDLVYSFGDDEEEINLAYAESYYAVLYINEFYGKKAVLDLLSEFNKGASADKGFEKAFEKNPEEFEKDYTVWLKQRIETPPPNTETQKTLSNSEINLIYFSLTGLCLLPLCFVVFGSGTIFALWKLITRKKDQTKTP